MESFLSHRVAGYNTKRGKAIEVIEFGNFSVRRINADFKEKKRSIDCGVNRTKLFIDRNAIGESMICPTTKKKEV